MELRQQPEKAQDGEFQGIKSIDVQARFKILYVKAGFAKAGHILLGQRGRDDELAKQISDELLSLGMVSSTEVASNNHIYINYSDNKKDFDDFISASNQVAGDISQTHRVNGKFYGTPQTAIDGHANDTQFQYYDLPKDILENPISRLIHYSMSKEHYKQEWKSYLENAKATAAKFPDLIKKFELSRFFEK